MNLYTQIERSAGKPEELIQVLHLVQRELGYVSVDMQKHVAETLGVPISQVYGVVTFYHLFRTRPAGRHTIRLCLGTACHVLGADRIRSTLEDELRISVGETTKDDLFSLEVVRCLGTCSLAPVMMIDEDVHGRLTPEKVRTVLRTYGKRKETSQ